jgi:four helix bundle protein
MKQNIIKDKSYNFSIETIKLVRQFPKSPEAYIIAKQLIRSSTSIGANVEEAITGFTKRILFTK